MRKHWLIGMALASSMVSAWTQSSDNSGVQPRNDLELWHQAGMSFLPPVQEFPEVKFSPEYRRYEELRSQRDAVELATRKMEMEPTAATLPAKDLASKP